MLVLLCLGWTQVWLSLHSTVWKLCGSPLCQCHCSNSRCFCSSSSRGSSHNQELKFETLEKNKHSDIVRVCEGLNSYKNCSILKGSKFMTWSLCRETTGALVTWFRWWGPRGKDGILSFSNLAYPILMSVTVEVIPQRVGAIRVAHHLYTVLPTLVIVWLPVTPVGVGQRRAIAPRISCNKGGVVFRFILYLASI